MIEQAPYGVEVLTSWRMAPLADGFVLAATVGYLMVARVAAASGERSRREVAARVTVWLVAMLVLVTALNGAVAVLGDELFWVHMIQHLLLIMVVPVLLVWARPLTLLGVAAGPRRRAVLERVLGSRPVRVATFPLTALAGYAAVVVLTHLTGFQQLAVLHPEVRAAETVLYLLSGYLVFLPLVGSEVGPWSLSYLLRLVVLVVAMGVDTLTGVALMLTGTALAPAYAAAHPGWGPDALTDQGIAGAIMWFGGDGLMMVLIVVVAVQWGRAEPSRQGLGSWLEGARRRALLGHGPGERDDGVHDLDDDQRALDAYNAMLASLDGRRPEPGRDDEGTGPRG